MAASMTTVVTTVSRPRVEAELARIDGLEIVVGYSDEPALRRVPVGQAAKGGSAQKSASGGRRRSGATARGSAPGPRGGASMGNSGVATRIEPIPGMTLARLGAIHEFGAPRANVPERKPIRRALEDGRHKIRRRTQKILTTAAAGKRTTALVDALAAEVRSMVQEAIRTTTSPPMSPRHRARRIAMGDPNPQLLFDIGQLHDGVRVRVTKGARR